MLTLYGVGCAFVRVGTWSSLSTESRPAFLFFKLNGCHLMGNDTTDNNMFNLKTIRMKKIFLLCVMVSSLMCLPLSIYAQSPIKYQGETDLAYSVGVGTFAQNRVSFHFINGIKAGNYFSTGVGVGLDFYHQMSEDKGELVIPVFLNLKGYLPVSNKVNPYLSFDIGAGIGATEGISGASGLYLMPAIGVNVKDWNTIFQFGYNVQRFSESGIGINVNAIQFKFGILF